CAEISPQVLLPSMPVRKTLLSSVPVMLMAPPAMARNDAALVRRTIVPASMVSVTFVGTTVLLHTRYSPWAGDQVALAASVPQMTLMMLPRRALATFDQSE